MAKSSTPRAGPSAAIVLIIAAKFSVSVPGPYFILKRGLLVVSHVILSQLLVVGTGGTGSGMTWMQRQMSRNLHELKEDATQILVDWKLAILRPPWPP